MGYTHYWGLHKEKSFNLEQHYNNAKNEICLFIKTIQMEKKIDLEINFNIDRSPNMEINFNGVNDDGHENFYMPSNYQEIIGFAWNFCKTARKPYDLVVMGSLFIIKKHLGNAFYMSSDGYSKGRYIDQEVKTAFKYYNKFQKTLNHNMAGIPITWYFNQN